MIDIAILGATGTVGQKFVLLLQNHPHFRIKELVASDRSAGKKYSDACTWLQAVPMPSDIANITVKSTSDSLDSEVLFSGLDSSVAFETEKAYAQLGHKVISNAKNHRMEPNVPLVIPEINHTHLYAVNKQSYKGFIVTNPNCATMAIAMAIAPLHKEFGITKLMAHTMQAISGAGYPGVASIDILGNVIPHIDGEEDKVETETFKILGDYDETKGFIPTQFDISAHCNRIPVIDGHSANLSISFKSKPSREQILDAWKNFKGFPQENNLFSAPQQPLWYLPQENRPQPVKDIWNDKGMASSIGRLRECNIFDYKFTVLGHNTIRGAAGAAVLNAESMLAMKLI